MSIKSEGNTCLLPHYGQVVYVMNKKWKDQFWVLETIRSIEINQESDLDGRKFDALVINFWEKYIDSDNIISWFDSQIFLGPGDKFKLNPDDKWTVLTKNNIHIWKEQLSNILAINSL